MIESDISLDRQFKICRFSY